jgi:hypothetical protein
VAIGAIFPNVGEDRLDMAARAGNFFVHAAKRVTRGVVVEFWNGANGGPTRAGMAIFAGDIQGPVRTPARLPLGHCGRDHG